MLLMYRVKGFVFFPSSGKITMKLNGTEAALSATTSPCLFILEINIKVIEQYQFIGFEPVAFVYCGKFHRELDNKW
jgi:hypothetical protein